MAFKLISFLRLLLRKSQNTLRSSI